MTIQTKNVAHGTFLVQRYCAPSAFDTLFERHVALPAQHRSTLWVGHSATRNHSVMGFVPFKQQLHIKGTHWPKITRRNFHYIFLFFCEISSVKYLRIYPFYYFHYQKIKFEKQWDEAMSLSVSPKKNFAQGKFHTYLYRLFPFLKFSKALNHQLLPLEISILLSQIVSAGVVQ